MTSSWTDENVETLKQLVAERRSSGEIAARLGNGITRSAVIGKAFRLGLQLKSQTRRPAMSSVPAAPRKAPAPRPRPKSNHKDFVFGAPPRRAGKAPPASPDPSPGGVEPQLKDIVAVVADPPEHERKALHELGDGCKWPIDGKFCGRPQSPRGAGVYCHSHASRAYQGTGNPKRKWAPDDPRRQAASARALRLHAEGALR